MNPLRPVLTVVVFAVLPGSWAWSQDKPAPRLSPVGEAVQTVKKEFQEASKACAAHRAAEVEAKKQGKEESFRFDKPDPSAIFSPRFLAIAEKHPEAPEAIDALQMALLTSNDVNTGAVYPTREKVAKILRDRYADKPSIKGLLRHLTICDDPASRALVADVIARNPDRDIQVRAYKGLVVSWEMILRFAEAVKDPQRREMIEKQVGKEYVQDQLVKAEPAQLELDRIRKRLREKYGDLTNDLSIGAAAPELKLPDIDGKTATLSSLKGKVVVLDIWTTWCGPCKAMIPHEREMVERLKDKPFALVSISVDEKKETLTDISCQGKDALDTLVERQHRGNARGVGCEWLSDNLRSRHPGCDSL